MGRRQLAAAILLVAAAVPAAAAVRAGTESVLPSVARAPGVLPGSEFRTDLWIYNPGTVTTTVTVHFYPRDLSFSPPAPAVLQEIGPGQVREVLDALYTLFALTNAVGGLRFVSAQPVVVTARIYDTAVQGSYGTGTAGQFDAATPLEEAIRAGQSTDIIGVRGLTSGAQRIWRTNVAFMNASANPTVLRLAMLDGNGNEIPPTGTVPDVTLRAWEPKQLNDVFDKLKRPASTNARVRLSVLSGGPVVALGSMLDGRTNDPSTIQMTAAAGGDGTYLCKADKITYDTPITLTMSGGAFTAIDATVLVTDEDVPTCSGGELARLAGSLPQPVFPDEVGRFAVLLAGSLGGGAMVSVQLDGRLTASGGIAGTVTTALTGVGACSGSKTWPLVGARLP